MAFHEYVGNLHIHTPYSDGEKYHADIAAAARRAGIDFIVVTDHNFYVGDVEGYYGDAESGYMLLLCGEEVHDRLRLPQVNHCLVYNVGRELCMLAENPQALLDEVNHAKGLSFLAHPHDERVAWLRPDSDGIAIPWVDWGVGGYTGLEIWNYMSAWKDTLPTPLGSLRSFFRPDQTHTSPPQATLDLWDRLLAAGQRVVGIGNADAHGTVFQAGFFKHVMFHYEFLFRCVNTHVLCPTRFSGDLEFDRQLLFDALGRGRAFIGYSIPGDPRGFRYSAQGKETNAEMGERIRLGMGVTLQVKTPARGHIKIIRHGAVVGESHDADALVYHAGQPGAYRVEVWKVYRGKPRCWILSNPIYVVE